MKIAIIGIGFVADYYMTTLANYPQLELGGVYDRDPVRLKQFSDHYKVSTYPSFEAILADEEIVIVVNLTTPENHYSLSKQALEAGKHVYCEKPLAMRYEEAAELVAIAERQDLTLASAPANALSAAHELVAGTLDQIGKPRPGLCRDGGTGRSSAPTGSNGALYQVRAGRVCMNSKWVARWNTPVMRCPGWCRCSVRSRVFSAFSALTFPDKGPETEAMAMAPDFSAGCLLFRSGVIARLTCGLAAPRNRSLTILGDGGTITVNDLWDHRSPVYLETVTAGRSLRTRLFERLEIRLKHFLPWKPLPGRRLSYEHSAKPSKLPAYPSQIDFAGGIAAQAAAIELGSPPFSSGRVALHITELALALNNAGSLPQPYRMQSTF